MGDEMIGLAILLKGRHRIRVKRYEMSEATLRHIETQIGDSLIPLMLEECRSSALWGIPIHFDNEIPFGEIKPIYV